MPLERRAVLPRGSLAVAACGRGEERRPRAGGAHGEELYARERRAPRERGEERHERSMQRR